MALVLLVRSLLEEATLLAESSPGSTVSLVVHCPELATSFLALWVAPLPRLLPEQEVSLPMSLELLETLFRALVLPLLVYLVALQVLCQALSEVSFLGSTVSQAEFYLDSVELCPTLAALLVPFQQLSAELCRTSAQELEVP